MWPLSETIKHFPFELWVTSLPPALLVWLPGTVPEQQSYIGLCSERAGKLRLERLLQTRAAETSGRSGCPSTGVTRTVFFSTTHSHRKLMSRCLVWAEQGQYVTSAQVQLPASLSLQQRDPELLQLCSRLRRCHQWGWGRSCSWSCSPIPKPSRHKSARHSSLSRCRLLEASCVCCSAGCWPQRPLCNLAPVCNVSHRYMVASIRGVRQRNNGWLKAICQYNDV